ncbi:MAG: U32 family peptidase, partial [Clostridia bacterium]|nr:U32 family peptidase [Clostridia bacterium]
MPELLCPVGSVDALKAAVAGGADAVYMGTSSFNARMHAHPFTSEETEEAIRLAHVHGVKVYITLNTVVMDRELGSWLEEAEFVYRACADGLIIADIGAASLLHQRFPDFPLHASTQMSVHHSDAGTMLKDAGFSRMVVARETSFEDLKTVCEKSPIEIECFIHGALCVSHSGQCLFSSLVGGRSGNRGECAQPCRLPYQTGRTQSYPLSLKDLSLAQHVPELLSCGLASLKIEGRMKSPDYVYTVTKIWRTLLDEKRSATPEEMDTLSSSFSRDGFTDGYFTSQVQGPSASGMLGVRTDQDKAASAQSRPFSGDLQKKPLDITFSMQKNAPLELELSLPDRTDARVHVEGPVPELARTQPLNRDQIHKQLCKFGNTPFEPNRVVIDCDDGLMVPV